MNSPASTHSEGAPAGPLCGNERLKLLLDLNNAIVSNLDLRDLLRRHLGERPPRNEMRFRGSGASGPRTTSGCAFTPWTFRKDEASSARKARCPAAEGPTNRVFRNGEPIALDARALATWMPATWPWPRAFRRCATFPWSAGTALSASCASAGLHDQPFTADEVDFVRQVAAQVAIAVENALAYRQIAELKDKLAQEKLYLEDEIRSQMNFDSIVGRSAALQKVLQQVETVAPTDSTVLIYGETGVGKELVARAIHNSQLARARSAL